MRSRTPGPSYTSYIHKGTLCFCPGFLFPPNIFTQLTLKSRSAKVRNPHANPEVTIEWTKRRRPSILASLVSQTSPLVESRSRSTKKMPRIRIRQWLPMDKRRPWKMQRRTVQKRTIPIDPNHNPPQQPSQPKPIESAPNIHNLMQTLHVHTICAHVTKHGLIAGHFGYCTD